MATRKDNENKKHLAHLLYTREMLTQEEIASRVGVSRITIGRWIKDGRWEELKVSLSMTREEQIKNLYRNLASIQEALSLRPEGERYPTPAEGDAIAKLTKSIKALETEVGISEITSVFSGLLSWLRELDLEECKRITPLLDAYVKSKLP